MPDQIEFYADPQLLEPQKSMMQKRVESKCYSAIDEIIEELDLDIPYYPEVYWINKSFDFETLGLPEYYRDEFELMQDVSVSKYMAKPKILLIAKDSPIHISEEASHFVHLANSNYRFRKRSRTDEFSANALIEMLGYFGSKIIVPERTPFPYDSYGDITDRNEVNSVKKKLLKDYSKANLNEFAVHQQGYVLGEKLFKGYKSKQIGKFAIRKLFLADMEKINPSILLLNIKDILNIIPSDFLKSAQKSN